MLSGRVLTTGLLHLLLRSLLNESGSLVELSHSVVLRDQIHFVNEYKDLSIGGVFLHGLQHAIKERDVIAEVPRLNVEHIDEHLHVAEDGISLRVEIAFVKAVLPAAVPQIEHQVSEKPDVSVLHIYTTQAAEQL